MSVLLRCLGLIGLMLLAFLAQAELQSLPELHRPVTDLTATLTATQVFDLEQKLRNLETRKGSQIAVLILETTQPEAIEQYSIRVAEQWKVGRKSTDDGVILLIAKQDRQMRIEVGYGLEGAIPDAYAKRIIAEIISPRFKQSDFYGGISAGVDSLIGLISGEALPEPQADKSDQELGPGGFLVFWFVISGFVSHLFNRFFGAAFSAGLAGFLAWLVFATMSSVAIAAVVGFVIGLLLPEILQANGRGADYGGSQHGWSSGSSNWRGGGGGGGFGGGGASGGW